MTNQEERAGQDVDEIPRKQCVDKELKAQLDPAHIADDPGISTEIPTSDTSSVHAPTRCESPGAHSLQLQTPGSGDSATLPPHTNADGEKEAANIDSDGRGESSACKDGGMVDQTTTPTSPDHLSDFETESTARQDKEDQEYMSQSAAGMKFMWNLSRSPHQVRAWTFQEVKPSRRCLFFFGNQVVFQCQESRRVEDGSVVKGGQYGMNTAAPLDVMFPSWPFRYSDFVYDYTRRRLTFPADRLGAFSALTSALETAWGWSFRYALPVQDFSHAVLWVPEDPVACRTDGRETLPLPAEYLFPSWSWLSYPGGSYYFLEFPEEGLESFIDWSATKFWDGQRARPLVAADGQPQSYASEDFPLDDLFGGFPPGTMVIMTYTAGLKVLGEALTSPEVEAFEERREDLGSYGHIYTPLVNPEVKWYGTLLCISETQLRDLLQREDMELAFVVLSTSVKTWVMRGFSHPVPCFDVSECKDEPWCTVDVILRPYRRLAVGEIHYEEWKKLSPEPVLVWSA